MEVLRTILDPRLWPASIWVLAFTGVAYLVANLLQRPAFAPRSPPVFEAWPVVGALRFFTRRNVFLQEITRRSKSGQASFYYGKYQIVGLSGEDGRRTFFESRDLSIGEGYAVLFNAAPHVKSDAVESLGDKVTRSLAKFMRKENLISIAPQLVADSRAAIERLAAREQHIVEPFVDLHKLVYQLTMRTVGCTEIASDPVLLAKTLSLFEGIDGASPATKLILPWLPTPGHMRRMWAGLRMYLIFKKIVDERKRTGTRVEDSLQVLMDQDMSLEDMVGVVVASLFAGLINSGINAAWLICFLGENVEWRKIIQREVDDVIEKHRSSKEQTPADVLATLAFEEWEVEFPMIDLGLKETIRHSMAGCGFRQNVSGKDIKIGNTGEVIPNNAFAVYLFDDTMMNPDVYTEPLKWDPGRYLPERADDKKVEAHGYIGWGSGRHPCLGMRFAKMEMAVIVAMFVAYFDFILCDKEGKPSTTRPDFIDRSQHSASKPKAALFVKYTPRT